MIQGRKVKRLLFNWHQAGSIQDNSGCGENWLQYVVGVSGVISIEENIPNNGMELWNYVITTEDGTTYRVFNPNFVEYFATETP